MSHPPSAAPLLTPASEGVGSLQNKPEQTALFSPVNRKIMIWSALSFSFFLTVAAQLLVSLNSDVGWYVFTTARWLDGATLYKDILETNPPMVYLLTAPVILLKNWLGISSVGAAKGYFLLATFLGYGLQLLFARPLFPRQAFGFYAVASSLILLLLPVGDFGQRDHLATLFLLPYFYSRFAWAEGRKHSLPMRLTAGVLLGIAGSLKHYFLLFPLLTELWLWLVARKRWHTLLSVEAIAAALVGAAFAAFVVLKTDFLTGALPLIRVFYPEFGVPLVSHRSSMIVYLAVLIMNSIGAFILKDRFGRSLTLFLTGLSGIGLIVFMVQAHFGYQLRPFVSLMLLTWTVFAVYFLKQSHHFRTTVKHFIWLPLILLISSGVLLIFFKGPILWHALQRWRLPTPHESGHVLIAQSVDSINRYAAGQPVYVFTTHGFWASMLANYSDAIYVSRLLNHWFLPAIDRAERFGSTMDPDIRTAALAAKPQYLRIVGDEIDAYQPALILIDRDWKFMPAGFNFWHFVENNPTLNRSLSNYTYAGFDLQPSFDNNRVAVYIRKDLFTSSLMVHLNRE